MQSRFVLVMLLVMSAPDTLASDEGFYAAFDAGQSRISGLCNTLPSTVNCIDTAPAFRLAAGYQFTPIWGMELAYAHFFTSTSEGTITTISPNGSPMQTPYGELVRIRGSLLSGVATIPLVERWSLITKLGDVRLANINVLVEIPSPQGSPSGVWQHTGTTRFSLYWGVGVLYEYSDAYSIRAQYEDFGTVGDAYSRQFGLKMVTVGVVHKFY